MKAAVVGATGAVGETIVRVLEERAVPIGTLGAFASRAREGAVRFHGQALDVRPTSDAALRSFDVVFFASSEDASERYAPALIDRGAIVIDNSSTYRLQTQVPLIVPEINAASVRADQRLFPVGNCTAIILSVALSPIRDVAGLRSVRVATYQAASGAGRAGLDELMAGERALASESPAPQPQVFPAPLAGNVVPLVGSGFDADGSSGEERKVRDETRKMLDLPKLRVAITSVRVPVRTAHSEAIFVKTERPVKLEKLAEAFRRAPGIVYHEDGIVTPRDVEGSDPVHVARLRAEDDSRRNFMLWAVGDQLRKGAATNAVQILELLLERGYVHA